MAQKTKTQLQAISSQIRNETAVGGNTKTRVAGIFTDIIDTLCSLLENGQMLTSTTGTNDYALNGSIESYSNTYFVISKFTNASTGASTLNVNSIASKKIYKDATTQAGSGDIKANGIYLLVYDSSLDGGSGGFMIIGGVGASGGGSWGDITGTLTDQTDLVSYVEGVADNALTVAQEYADDVSLTAENNAKTYADGLVVGLWDDRGNYDASGNAYPSSGGSGTAGAIKKGDIWTISVAGTLPTGRVVEPGDTVRALVDTPGSTAANWAIQQNNIGYTPENVSNKSTDGTFASPSNTSYPTTQAVKTLADTKQASLGYTPENAANKGAANGYASLDSGGKVPSGQLPSFVDDVLEYANLAAFPGTGEAGKIYIAIDTNLSYRWGGSVYVLISSTPANASETVRGIIEISTQAEVSAGTDDQTAVSPLKLRAELAATTSTGVAIKFDKPRTYGISSPETGNITFDSTGAVPGQVALIRHNHSSEPTFGSEFKKLSGSRNYASGVVNYIFCTYVSPTEILYTVDQLE